MNRLLECKTLHDLLLLAISDFEKILDEPNICINMSAWVYKPSEDVCYCCLAGAAILKEFDHKDFEFEDDDLNIVKLDKLHPGTSKRLCAINSLRCGGVREAHRLLYSVYRDDLEDDIVPPFRQLADRHDETKDNRKQYIGALMNLHNYLVEKNV